MTVEEAHKWLQGLHKHIVMSGSGYNEVEMAQVDAAKCQQALAVLEYHQKKQYGYKL